MRDVEQTADMEGSRKLLVIDDDAIVRDSIVTYLEDSSFQVIEASNGIDGIELFKKDKPDLVICDLRMPNMDGLRVLKEIMTEDPDVPVIVVSGAGVISDVVAALRLGASDYLIKPIVDLEVLEHAVERCIDRADLVHQNRKYREELEQTNKEMRDHLRMLEQDQQAGRHVQMKMMPPKETRYGKYLLNQQVIPSLYLSGDFVEYMELDDKYLCFYIADVSGHGASSAFVTVLLKNLSTRMINIYDDSAENLISPADVLSWANKELIESELDKHVTMFVAMIDKSRSRMFYSVAGHLPMPIMASKEAVYYLEGRALPVGIFEGAEYTNYMVKLPDEFSLCMFSDGILEIMPADSLTEKENKLLAMVRDGCRTVDEFNKKLKILEIKDAPDDIAIMTVTKEA